MKTLSLFGAILLLVTAFVVAQEESNKVDTEIEKLLDTDRAWSEAAGGDNIDSILTFWSDDAVLFNVFKSGKNIVGKKAIEAMVRKRRSVPGSHISWTPTEGYVSGDGDVGATRGVGTVINTKPDGTADTLKSTYFNVWKKVDGQWKCAFETHE